MATRHPYRNIWRDMRLCEFAYWTAFSSAVAFRFTSAGVAVGNAAPSAGKPQCLTARLWVQTSRTANNDHILKPVYRSTTCATGIDEYLEAFRRFPAHSQDQFIIISVVRQ